MILDAEKFKKTISNSGEKRWRDWRCKTIVKITVCENNMCWNRIILYINDLVTIVRFNEQKVGI